MQYDFGWFKGVMARVPDIQFDQVKVSTIEGDPSSLAVQIRYHFVDNPEFITTLEYTTDVDDQPEDMFARGEWPEGATFT
jgi:hypothetical protein